MVPGPRHINIHGMLGKQLSGSGPRTVKLSPGGGAQQPLCLPRAVTDCNAYLSWRTTVLHGDDNSGSTSRYIYDDRHGV